VRVLNWSLPAGVCRHIPSVMTWKPRARVRAGVCVNLWLLFLFSYGTTGQCGPSPH
jgi:hypothetical protein